MLNKLMLLFMLTIGMNDVLSLPEKDGLGVCKKSNTSDKMELFCCEGFTEVNNTCVDCPECRRQTKCPGQFCGDGCINTCNCHDYEECDDWYCCTCAAGFTGPYCNQSCSVDYYGHNCMRKCLCFEGDVCDHVSGNCSVNAKANTSEISSGMGHYCCNNISESILYDHTEYAKERNIPTNTVISVVIALMGTGTVVFLVLSLCIWHFRRQKNCKKQQNDLLKPNLI